ncbi:MAG TPA: lamin tail domain-containing protein, partial [bacterium]|nr:lamin tail domain-containing protein [bacterium]
TEATAQASPFSFSVLNTKPAASSVYVSSSDVPNTFSISALTANFTYSDADGDAAGSHSYQWYKNGAAIAGETGATLSGVFSKDDACSFVVAPYDGYSYGDSVTSNTTLIIGKLTSFSITAPETTVINTNFSLTITARDEGGDLYDYDDSITITAETGTASPAGSNNFTNGELTQNFQLDTANDSITVTVAGGMGTGGTTSDLIISEYIEGSAGVEKYIEVYNGTGSDVNLADYRLRLYSNGSSSTTQDIQLSGTLTNGSCIVYTKSGTTYAGSKTANNAVDFNGDDAVVLYKISTTSPVDIIGCIGEDPGTAWTSGSHTTLDKTLVRKTSVLSGVSTNPGSGFPTLESEWDMYDDGDVSHLGEHNVGYCTGTAIISAIPQSGFGSAVITIPDSVAGTIGDSEQSISIKITGTSVYKIMETIKIEVPAVMTWTGNSADVSLSGTGFGGSPSKSVSGSGSSTDSWIITITGSTITNNASGTVTISNLTYDGGLSKFAANPGCEVIEAASYPLYD